jgi:hypothetical protein
MRTVVADGALGLSTVDGVSLAGTSRPTVTRHAAAGGDNIPAIISKQDPAPGNPAQRGKVSGSWKRRRKFVRTAYGKSVV